MKTRILGIVLGVLIGIPTIAFGSSFTYSLVEGKTPSEAISILAAQIESLTTRLNSIESAQEEEAKSEQVVSTSSSSAESPVSPKVQTDSIICVNLKAQLLSLQDQEQKLKMELVSLKNNGTGEIAVSMEDQQRILTEVKQKVDVDKAQIAVLDTQIKSLVAQIKEEICI
ncbi:MAG: hypothetical protein WCW36_01765 [Candidatus Paceibacterota bacterium]